MLDFYRTGGGRRLIDSTLPEISRQIKRLADELHRANTLKEIELGIRKLSPAEVAKEFVEGGEAEPVEDSDGFVRKLLDEIGDGLTLRGKDVEKLRDTTVRGMLAVAGVKIEFNDEDGSADLTREG